MAEGADELAALLDATAGVLARTTERQESTAATPEQVDLVGMLRALKKAIPTLLPRIMQRQVKPDEWEMMAKILASFSAEFHRQALILEGSGYSDDD